ncbi:hypothetical protein AAFF_G00272740 [Aldrovandia affinis]|uniref:Uncharacterized protein n=1 Tax=Aldrovandia affinis TaxID=143900 RepID=A0AAD7W298_9TELE|nr:hypothetical protein AAFF_G00272740 [Aldrovandia affinis]
MLNLNSDDFDSLEIQQQYNDINNRWDLAAETDWDNENSSARLFERSRIKALAGGGGPLRGRLSQWMVLFHTRAVQLGHSTGSWVRMGSVG